MSVSEQIVQRLNQLTEAEQIKVLDFVESLQTQNRQWQDSQVGHPPEAALWSTFSLACAMRGLEDDPTEYTLEDLQESF